MRKLNTKEFIERAILVHGDKYDYSSINYIDNRTKITFFCKKYGKVTQLPQHHLNGMLPTAVDKNNKFKIDSIEVHGNKYDYSKVNYINAKTPVTIVCPTHGEYKQKPYHHLQGSGCQECGYEKVEEAKKLDKNYIKRIINNNIKDKGFIKNFYFETIDDYVVVHCNNHGDYKSKVSNLMKGSWCDKCNRESLSSNTQEFLIKAEKIHSDKYDYSEVDYTNSKTYVTIVCPVHGKFNQVPNGHLNGNGCPKCSSIVSKAEIDISKMLSKYTKVISSDRSVLNGMELDIYLPKYNIAIEYNGLYWHSDKFKDKNFHRKKTIECNKKGIRLIHIFEDEWRDKKDIVKSRLLSFINKTPTVLYARNTVVKEVPTKQAMQFLKNNHIQGKAGASIKLGLYYNKKLVSLMTFGGHRVNMGGKNKDGEYELIRFCSLLNHSVVGGASKLLNSFIKIYKPKVITSYADIRWSQGDVYDKLGFKRVHESTPNYYYTKGINRINRFKFRKSEIIKLGFDKNKTEKQIMNELGYYRIYDCGTIKYEKHLVN